MRKQLKNPDYRERLKRNVLDGLDYEPIIHYRDFSSRGIVSRLKGRKVERVYSLLSTLKRDFFILCETLTPGFIDLKEQISLDINETKNIAETLGIRHPSYFPKGKKEKVLSQMSTDFLLTYEIDGKIFKHAFNVKYKKDLNKKSHLEKIKIELEYWKERNIPLSIISENDINKTLVSNISMLRNLKEPTPEEEYLFNEFKSFIKTSKDSLIETLENFALVNETQFEIAFYLFKLAIYRGFIEIELDKPIDLEGRKYVCKSDIYEP